MKDIVLGGRANALSIVRALGRSSIAPRVVTTDGASIAAASRYAGGGVCVSPRADDILQLLREESADEGCVLYVTDDFWVRFIAERGDDLAAMGFYFFFNRPQTNKALLDKLVFYEDLKDHIPIPPTRAWHGTHRENEVVKPRCSFQGPNVVPKGFKRQRQHEEGDPDFIAQQFVQASLHRHVSISGIRTGDGIISHVGTRKLLEYPNPGGTAVLVETDPALDRSHACFLMADQALSILDYRGAFEAEFIETEEQTWLLEINARFWLQHAIGLPLGLNFVLLYRQALTDPEQATDAQGTNQRALWLHEGLPVALASAHRVDRRVAFGALFWKRKRVWAHLAVSDVKPFLAYTKWRTRN